MMEFFVQVKKYHSSCLEFLSNGITIKQFLTALYQYLMMIKRKYSELWNIFVVFFECQSRLVGWVLWHINLVGYLMPNTLNTYIKYIW